MPPSLLRQSARIKNQSRIPECIDLVLRIAEGEVIAVAVANKRDVPYLPSLIGDPNGPFSYQAVVDIETAATQRRAWEERRYLNDNDAARRLK